MSPRHCQGVLGEYDNEWAPVLECVGCAGDLCNVRRGQDPPWYGNVFGVPADTEMSEAVRRVLSLDNASRAELVQARVARAIEAFQERRGDTGSSAVQVAALTVRIEALKEHMAKHRKDNSSKRGLDALNNKRRKILKYMKRKDFEAFRDTVRLLNLDNIVKSLK